MTHVCKCCGQPVHSVARGSVKQLPRHEKFIMATMFVEGGHSNHQNDKGGHTLWGLSSRYNPDLTEEIKDGTLSFAKAIDVYRMRYYKPAYIDEVKDDRLAYLCYTLRVQGNTTYNQALQDAIKAMGYNIKSDGVIGRGTRTALNGLSEKEIQWLLSYLLYFATAYGFLYKNKNDYTKQNSASLKGARNRLLRDVTVAKYRLFDNIRVEHVIGSARNELMNKVENLMIRDMRSHDTVSHVRSLRSLGKGFVLGNSVALSTLPAIDSMYKEIV